MLGFFKRDNINKGVEEFKATPGAMLIDVRTKNEYQSGHVPGSLNVDAALVGVLSSLVNDRSVPMFVYCLSGARSSGAVNTLKGMGYTNVKNIGGISAYNGPIEKGA